MPDRVLAWDGCLNVRDLGGFETEDGRLTRFGRIVRADTPSQLSEAGWRAMRAHGVTTIVDLRSEWERADDPPRADAVDVVHVPVLGDPDEERWSDLDRRAAAADDHAAATTLVYRDVLAVNGGQLAAAVGAVADARPGAVLVHCVGGKDRTALVTAFLLRLAGVPVDDIAEDYALSERYLAPRHEEWFAGARDDAERERLRRIAATPAPAMRAVLRELETRDGGVAGYLRAHGLSGETLERARARLLD